MTKLPLQDHEGVTRDVWHSRYKGPDIDRLSEFADYDPQDVAISSAYTTAINHYESGHMVYVNEDVLKKFRADVAGFVKSASEPVGK